jgi:hypothetical protein
MPVTVFVTERVLRSVAAVLSKYSSYTSRPPRATSTLVRRPNSASRIAIPMAARRSSDTPAAAARTTGQPSSPAAGGA